MSDTEDSLSLSPNTELDELALEGLTQRMQADQQRLAKRERQAAMPPPALETIPGIGRYMPPSENTYAAHREVIVDTSLDLSFAPKHFPAFDELLTNTNPLLHETLAIMRNALLPAQANSLAAIARYLNTQLAGPLNPQPGGKGAQEIYQALLKRQHTPLLFMPSIWFSPADWPNRWNLPPLEASPFSDEALARAAPGPTATVSAVEKLDIVEMADRNEQDPRTAAAEREQTAAEELNAIANDMASAGALTMSVEELSEPTRRESIELAKDILNKLKVKLGEALLVNGLAPFDMNPLAILGELKHAVKVFEFHLHKVAGLDANIYENPAVARANAAVGKLSFLAKQETLSAATLHGDNEMIALIKADLMQLPTAWNPTGTDSFAGLLGDLESGLEAVLDRINQLGDKDAGAEYWLGFSTEKSLGSSDPTKGSNKQEKSMQDDTYYRQLNAQRALRARQAAIRYTQSMQRQRTAAHHDDDHHHAKQTAPARSQTAMSQLVSGDALNAMRSAMKTTSGAAAVETGTKANIQNTIKQKDQATKSQRQRTTVEQVRRSNERSQKQHQHDEQPIQPPPGKKKDHTHGI